MCTVQSILKGPNHSRKTSFSFRCTKIHLAGSYDCISCLYSCKQAPISQRLHGITSSRSWDSIIKFLNSLKSRFRGNYVVYILILVSSILSNLGYMLIASGQWISRSRHFSSGSWPHRFSPSLTYNYLTGILSDFDDCQ